jgi:hypothetical protein
MANAAVLCEIFDPQYSKAAVGAMRAFCDEAEGGLVAVGSPDYSGRVFVPVPSVILALPTKVDNQADLCSALEVAIATLNRAYGFGVKLVPSETMPGVFGVAPQNGSGSLLPGMTAWCYVGWVDGWLLASSDATVLARLLGHARGAKGGPSKSQVAESSAATLWIDGEGAAWNLQRLLMFYQLRTALSRRGDDAQMQPAIALAQKFADYFGRGGHFELSLQPDANGVGWLLNATR